MTALYMTVRAALGTLPRRLRRLPGAVRPRGAAARRGVGGPLLAALLAVFAVGPELAGCSSSASPTPTHSASPSPTPSPSPSHPVTLKVIDGGTDRPLAGVRLAVPSLKQVVETDARGAAVVQARRERQRLRIVPSYKGYAAFPLTVRPDRDGRIKIPLYRPATQWTTWGYDSARTHHAPSLDLGLPGKMLWKSPPLGMVEFPATLAYGLVIYDVQHRYMMARRLADGELVWKHEADSDFASQPAVSGRTAYFTLLNGSVRAYNCFTGRKVWKRTGMGPIESSPLIVGDLLYAGDWNGSVWALDRRNGRIVWRTNLGAKITSSPAYAGGTLYIGRYFGAAYALNARTGAVRWRAGGAGNFYGTPAVSQGRVVFPNSNGRAVYCFSASSGRLLWSRSLGHYVYSSPAIWRGLVYLGSYTGVFYALDLRTGAVRWSFASGGAISGGPSVVGGVVYFSNFAHRTYGLDARTGRVRWRFSQGLYAPVSATDRTIVVAAFMRLYVFRTRRG